MEGEADFTIGRRREGEAVVVAPDGEVDLATVHALRDAVRSAQRETRIVVVDLRAVTFMDSSGLRLLVELHRESDQDGFSLVVVRGPRALERLLDVTGLSDRLLLVDDPSQAAGGGGGPGGH